MRITSGFEAEHVLADGTHVTLRLIRPDDRDELARAFERLSAASRYRRFLTVPRELTGPTLDYLTRVDGTDHLALVALTPSHDLKEDVGVGIARFVRLPDEPAVAEAAVTVADEMQGKGLGRLLVMTLAEAAWERGIAAFRAEVLSSNVPMRRLLDDVGAKVVEEEEGCCLIDVALGTGDVADVTLLGRVLRVIASAVAAVRSLTLPR
jgi:GNAT superfamily N-acetyltransferase